MQTITIGKNSISGTDDIHQAVRELTAARLRNIYNTPMLIRNIEMDGLCMTVRLATLRGKK